MSKFVPYNKMSKRQRREVDKIQRSDWGTMNPKTQVSKNKKRYDRKEWRGKKDDLCNIG